MIRLQEYKVTRYEIIWGYISLIILILFSSFTSEIFLGNMTYNYASLILIILVYLFKYQSIPSIYFKVLLAFLFYNVIHLLIFQDTHPLFISRYLFYISLAYFTIRINYHHYLERLENIIYVGALISLPLFLAQCLFFSPFFSAMSSLQHILGIVSPSNHDGFYYTNTIFYTINTTDQNRNCGFMFEPGAFGAVIAIAIGLNLIHNNFKLYNKKLLVLLIALITTSSTTAFLALVCILLFYLVNKGFQLKIFLLPLFILIIFLLFQLPFMSNKIMKVSENPQKQLKDAVQMYDYTQRTQSLGRFAGLLLNLVDFNKSPVFGIGGHNVITEKARNRWGVDSVNGLGNYLVTFGFLGALFLLFNITMSFKKIMNDNDLRGYYYLVLIVLIISFSFMLIESPLLFSFQLYYVSDPKIIPASDLNLESNQLYNLSS